MPVDTKRVVGPDTTTPYRLYSEKHVKDFDQLKADVLNPDGTRKCDRKLNELRSIFSRVGIITQAKGSAYVEMGGTKVVASVYEPREIPKQTEFGLYGELYCEFKYAPFSCNTRMQLQPGNEEREMASSIKTALEPVVLRHLFANFQIDIFVYVLENNGSVLSSAINAAGLALADAEIPTYDIITAVTVGIQGKQVFVDPNLAEETYCLQCKPSAGEKEIDHGIAVVAKMTTSEQITKIWQHGTLSVDRTLSVVENAGELCLNLNSEFIQVLVHKVEMFLKNKKNDSEQNGRKDASDKK